MGIGPDKTYVLTTTSFNYDPSYQTYMVTMNREEVGAVLVGQLEVLLQVQFVVQGHQFALVLYAGGIGAWYAIEVWEEELEEFTKWTVFQVFL